MDQSKLVTNHWAYIEQVIRQEHETEIVTMTLDEYIKRIKFHYISAFEHGHKHLLQDMC